MNHVLIFYYFISLVVGIISLILLILVTIKTKDKHLFYYLLVFIFFTIFSIFMFLSSYLRINITSIYQNTTKVMDFLHFISQVPLFITIPVFIHSFFKIKHKILRNIIICLIISIAFILHEIFMTFYPENKFIFIFKNIDEFVIILLNFYIIIILIYKFVKSEQKSNKLLSILLIIYYLALIPLFIINELPIPIFEYFELVPVIYIIYGIITFIFIYKTYIKSPDIILDKNKFDKLLKKYDISKRESDILQLAVKGYSNKKISDELFIAESTVKTHLNKIFKKLNLSGRYDLISFFR